MRCPACQHANPDGARFCNGCGTSLTAANSATAPQAYTPPHLADKIRTARAGMVGERKQVTVLFADLKGSMELLADRDPEESRRLLDAVLERMMEAVNAERIEVLFDRRRGEQRRRFEELTEERRRAERRREQLDQDLRDWGFGVAPRRLG
jgi:hypothetical protein